MTDGKQEKKFIAPDVNVEELLKENAILKQANSNVLQFTFGITNTLDDTARSLVRAGNALFTISEKLKGIVNQNQSTAK